MEQKEEAKDLKTATVVSTVVLTQKMLWSSFGHEDPPQKADKKLKNGDPNRVSIRRAIMHEEYGISNLESPYENCARTVRQIHSKLCGLKYKGKLYLQNFYLYECKQTHGGNIELKNDNNRKVMAFALLLVLVFAYTVCEWGYKSVAEMNKGIRDKVADALGCAEPDLDTWFKKDDEEERVKGKKKKKKEHTEEIQTNPVDVIVPVYHVLCCIHVHVDTGNGEARVLAALWCAGRNQSHGGGGCGKGTLVGATEVIDSYLVRNPEVAKNYVGIIYGPHNNNTTSNDVAVSTAANTLVSGFVADNAGKATATLPVVYDPHNRSPALDRDPSPLSNSICNDNDDQSLFDHFLDTLLEDICFQDQPRRDIASASCAAVITPVLSSAHVPSRTPSLDQSSLHSSNFISYDDQGNGDREFNEMLQEKCSSRSCSQGQPLILVGNGRVLAAQIAEVPHRYLKVSCDFGTVPPSAADDENASSCMSPTHLPTAHSDFLTPSTADSGANTAFDISSSTVDIFSGNNNEEQEGDLASSRVSQEGLGVTVDNADLKEQGEKVAHYEPSPHDEHELLNFNARTPALKKRKSTPHLDRGDGDDDALDAPTSSRNSVSNFSTPASFYGTTPLGLITPGRNVFSPAEHIVSPPTPGSAKSITFTPSLKGKKKASCGAGNKKSEKTGTEFKEIVRPNPLRFPAMSFIGSSSDDVNIVTPNSSHEGSQGEASNENLLNASRGRYFFPGR
eukprot:gene26970-32585_t